MIWFLLKHKNVLSVVHEIMKSGFLMNTLKNQLEA